jgi:hypothetical protein
VIGNSKGFPTSHCTQKLDLYCRSYGDQRNFHLKARRAIQKTSSIIFLENLLKKCAMLDRSIPTRKALVHSIPISEVKDMKSDVLWAVKAFLSEKNFGTYLQDQF